VNLLLQILQKLVIVGVSIAIGLMVVGLCVRYNLLSPTYFDPLLNLALVPQEELSPPWF
jgi:hypothetical protein